MRNFSARQVHLDFHTSQWIPDVGKKFNKEQFQAALKEGNVGSITIFAKCHHGYCYYPTKVGTQHPTMEQGFDLTGAIIDAAHEVGVDAPVYITAGWSALDADTHPEWLIRKKDGTASMLNVDPTASPDTPFPDCSWKNLCLNGSYGEHIKDITREVVDRYTELDGLFYDICTQGGICYCDDCIAGMKVRGYDPENEADCRKYFLEKHLELMAELGDILHAKHPDASIFFNGCANETYESVISHFECEDLPTCWGGYNKLLRKTTSIDHFGKEIVGMTGKFHTVWGEFGGYKNPEALKYEVLMMAMNGAKCSIGDQMPPSGEMDMETYRIIGHAFRALEKMEPYAYPATSTADVGVYSSNDGRSNSGVVLMLLESQIDFHMVKYGDDLSRYKLLILPDMVPLTDNEADRINEFVRGGGAVIFGHKSAIKNGKFQIDIGLEYVSDPIFEKDYLCPDKITLPFGNAPFLCYTGAARVRATECDVLSKIYDPYFDRTYAHYCSHMNTPYRSEPSENPAVVQKGNVIYYAHPLCRMYEEHGAEVFKLLFRAMINRIYDPQIKVNIPSAGRVRLTYQEHESRYIFHISYVSPIQRAYVVVLEDIVPLVSVPVSIKMDKKISSVTLIPDRQEIPFVQENGVITFTIDKVESYQAVELKIEG